MSRVNIKIKKTHVDAQLPRANNVEPGTGDTGFDLTAVETVKIPAFDSKVVPVGLTLADIDPGYWIRIEPRSGLGFKHSIQPHLGVIDNGYRGDLGVKLYNFNDDLYTVKKGDKIAQLVVYPLIQPVFEFSDEVSNTVRGDKGFGSSDQGMITKDGNMWTYKNSEKILISCHESDKKFMERMVEKDQKSSDN
jgi:dUTP pyrophosphatase